MLKLFPSLEALSNPTAMAEKSDHEQKHSALVTRRSQLLSLINQEKNRLKQTRDDDVTHSIQETLDTLNKQLKILTFS